MASVLTELLIYFALGWRLAAVENAPYWLIRERIGSHETARQVMLTFSGDAVRRVTHEEVWTTLEGEKASDIVWVTQTVPVEFLDVMRYLVRDRQLGDQARGMRDPEADAGTPGSVTAELSAGLRVVVGDKRTADLLVDRTPGTPFSRYDFLSPQNVRYCEQVVRTRTLALNGRAAIVHLPIPFLAREDEESNFCAIIEQPERVAQIRASVEALWSGCSAL